MEGIKYKHFVLNDFNQWNELILKVPLAFQDVYFKSEYYSLFQKNGEGKAQCFVLEMDGKIALYPFLLNSINNFGYVLKDQYYDIQGAYGYNGVCTNCYEYDFIEIFYFVFNKFCIKNNIIAEFTRFHPILENQKFSQKHLGIILDRETVTLNLTQTYNQIWLTEYSSKNRNMIRKAKKQGYTVKILTNPSISEIDQFVSIYYFSMKRVEAENYYLFDKNFFYNTFSNLKEYSYLFNILDINGQILCSSIFFHYGSFFHYHLSGKTENADNSVNSFLLDEAIKFAIEKEAKIFHLGGGRSNSTNDNLLKFKSSFSRSRLPFYIGKKIHNQEVYDNIVKQWENMFPEKKKKYLNYLLKYRY